ARTDGVNVLTLDSGEEITADHVISSIGAPETEALIEGARRPEVVVNTEAGRSADGRSNVGRLSFVETITVLNRQPAEFGWGDDTIIFFNDSEQFEYAQPAAAVDPRSGVICVPNNFDFGPGR